MAISTFVFTLKTELISLLSVCVTYQKAIKVYSLKATYLREKEMVVVVALAHIFVMFLLLIAFGSMFMKNSRTLSDLPQFLCSCEI